MRKEFIYHFSFLLGFLILSSIAHNYLNLSYWPYWVGGLIGTVLPDLDHLIYIYFLRPYELTSQRATHLMGSSLIHSLRLLSETRYERTKIIFHTALFQMIFLVLSLLIITSSGSILGREIVLGFLLHLLIDQLVDYMEMKNLDNWFKDFPIRISIKPLTYMAINTIIFLVFSSLL